MYLRSRIFLKENRVESVIFQINTAGAATGPRSRSAPRTSADQRHSPVASQPLPDTGRRPGCVCTGRKEKRKKETNSFLRRWMQK